MPVIVLFCTLSHLTDLWLIQHFHGSLRLLEPSSFSCLNYNLPITLQNMNYVLDYQSACNKTRKDFEECMDMDNFIFLQMSIHMAFARHSCRYVDIGSKNRNSFHWCDEFLANCSDPRTYGGDQSSVTHIVTHLVITDTRHYHQPISSGYRHTTPKLGTQLEITILSRGV